MGLETQSKRKFAPPARKRKAEDGIPGGARRSQLLRPPQTKGLAGALSVHISNAKPEAFSKLQCPLLTDRREFKLALPHCGFQWGSANFSLMLFLCPDKCKLRGNAGRILTLPPFGVPRLRGFLKQGSPDRLKAGLRTGQGLGLRRGSVKMRPVMRALIGSYTVFRPCQKQICAPLPAPLGVWTIFDRHRANPSGIACWICHNRPDFRARKSIGAAEVLAARLAAAKRRISAGPLRSAP